MVVWFLIKYILLNPEPTFPKSLIFKRLSLRSLNISLTLLGVIKITLLSTSIFSRLNLAGHCIKKWCLSTDNRK